MKRLIAVLVIFAALLSMAMTQHHVHYSLVRLDVNAKKGKTTLSFKIDAEDYKFAESHLLKKGMSMEQYLLTAFKAECTDAEIGFQYKSLKHEDDAVWFVYTADRTPCEKTIIRLTLFNGLFENQQSFFVLKTQKSEQASMFNSRNTSKTFTL